MISLNYSVFLFLPLVSGGIDYFEDVFIEPSVVEQKMFKDLLDEFLKLDINKKDVSGILSSFEKPSITTFPCDKTDVNELVVNVVETRFAGFSIPEEHEGVTVLGGTYSWQCKITTSSKGVITMDCDNTLMLNPDIINAQEKDQRIQEVDNLVILYHELLHGQLMLDAISSSEEWRNDVCRKTPTDKINYSYSDKKHLVINPLQDEFTSQLIEKNGGVFLIKEIMPEETDQGTFSKKITSRHEHPQFLKSGIKVTYRALNLDDIYIEFPGNDITISGKLRNVTKAGIAWIYLFEDSESKSSQMKPIPEWIKNNARWWSTGTITDSDFLLGIEYLIQNDIMTIQTVNEISSESEEIPSWIRNNAEWWADGLISDDEFVSGMKYLIEAGIISYQ